METARPAPPAVDGLVARPRLLRMLRRRFEVPIVVLVGGAGAGKTCLLAQAMADNQAQPAGVDLWWSCRTDDSKRSTLVHGLAAAAGLHGHRSDLHPTALLAAIAEQWPLGVCLIADDAHEVTPGSAGDAFLRMLIESAPPTVHLVLSSRRALPGLALRRARGAVVELREEDLRFTDEETRAAAPELDPAIGAGLGGWPALVSLAARFGAPAAAEFAWEAVVSRLKAEDRTALRAIALVGGGDRDIVTAAAGRPIDPSHLAEVPLVEWDGRRLVPHALWNEILAGELGDADIRAVQSRVGRVLLDRGDVERAGGLLADAGEWDAFKLAVRLMCSRGFAAIARDVVADWLGRLPPDQRETPEGLLLAGVTARALEPFGEQARDRLARAARAFAEAGDVGGEITAASELGFVSRARGEFGPLTQVIARGFELEAAGHEAARGPATLGRAVLADLSGDDQSVLELLTGLAPNSLPPEWNAIVHFLAMIAAFNLGDAGELRAAAARYLAVVPTDYVGRPFAMPTVDWHTGRPFDVPQELPDPGADPRSAAPDRLWGGSGVAIIEAYRGRPEVARRALRVATTAVGPASLPQLRGVLAAAAAATVVAEGDEEEARQALEAFLAEIPVTSPAVNRPLRLAFAIVYVLSAAVRQHWREAPLGPIHARNRMVADAFLDVCSGVKPCLDPAWPSGSEVAVALPLPWAADLAAGLAVAAPAAGRELAEVLVGLYGTRARDAWRRAASDEEQGASLVAEGARRLLASMGVAGSRPVEVRALGRAELVVNGTVVDDPDWRRERVRALLLYLAHRQRALRFEVVGAMWPDLPEEAGRRNLRVTLTHLQRLLEPHRQAGEAPFYLRQDGEWLELLGEPHVTVDAQRFEQLLDQAEDQRSDGDADRAVDSYEQALALWRGDYLADLADQPWVQLPTARLRSRYVSARIRLAQLELRRGRYEASAAHAAAALETEPWSEAGYQTLAAALHQSGDRAGSSRVLAQCRSMLADLGVEPAAETEMLERLVRGARA